MIGGHFEITFGEFGMYFGRYFTGGFAAVVELTQYFFIQLDGGFEAVDIFSLAVKFMCF
jgi:hypothetical protein